MRTILEDSDIDKRFWNKIGKVSSLTINQIPAQQTKKSLFKLFKMCSLPLSYFHPIGNRVSYIVLPEKSFFKIQTKGELGALIGYRYKLQSYRILTDGGKIVETKNV